MADRQRILRAVARQLAAERADAPSPRPGSARIPVPEQHLGELTAARTHQLRLTASAIDPQRLAAALAVAATRHDALRLGPVRDSGRCFLVDLEDPVARVASADELDQADPGHPLRWFLATEPGRVTVILAVSAYLMDRSCWGTVLATVAAAYRGTAVETLPRPELGYGDYCYWLAHRPDADPTAGRDVVRGIGHPAAEPYWAFSRGQPWAVLRRPVPRDHKPRAVAVDDLAAGLAAALRACGWQAPGVRMRRWRPRPPLTPIVGRVDEPVLGTVRPGAGEDRSAPETVVADALDAWWASFPEPLVQVDVDVLDLPRLRFDDEAVLVTPLLPPTPGYQAVLVRQPDGAELHLAGGELTLPAIHDAVGGNPSSGTAVVGATAPAVPDLPAPCIVTAQRTLAAPVVAAAVDRRAGELRDAGVRPGTPVVIECTEGPETVANLLAALRCRADVLLLEPDDPPPWRAGLIARLPGAVRVSPDNVVHAATDAVHPIGDGDGALLLGLSSAPGTPVLARVPLDDLWQGASALGELWRLADGRSGVVNAARAGEDMALTVLACGRYGADLVLVGGDGAEAVELLVQVSESCVDVHLVEDWAVPLHRLTGTRWWRRTTDATTAAAGRWWTAEAPAAHWLVTEQSLALRSGTARLVDEAGRSMPDGTVGELAVSVSTGCRYVDDPRRTAERLRPCPEGRRELRTGTLAGRLGSGIRVLRFAPDRAVHRNRTCLTDAWHAVVTGAFVGVRPVGEPAAEELFVVSPQPVGPVELPRPLASALIHVDPSAADLDAGDAWRRVQARTERPADDADEAGATAKEVILAKEAVERILGMPVRRTDDLFSLGATSMQLMRVLLQVKERVGVEVPLARFFATPTVAVLAELIAEPADPSAAALELLDEIAGEY